MDTNGNSLNKNDESQGATTIEVSKSANLNNHLRQLKSNHGHEGSMMLKSALLPWNQRKNTSLVLIPW